MCGIQWIELATAALAAWIDAFERAARREGPMQSEHRCALAAATRAADALAAGAPIQARFLARVTVARAADDEEYFERTRCWELSVNGARIQARRWLNLADMIGASQSSELAAAGGTDELLPACLGDWGPTLAVALERQDCSVEGHCAPA